MKKLLKIMMSLLLIALIANSNILLTWASTEKIQEDNSEASVPSGDIEQPVTTQIEEKTYCNVSVDENFSDSSLIVTMKNSVSLQFNEYDVGDFSEINVISVENLSPYTYNAVKNKYEAISAKQIKVENNELMIAELNNILKKTNYFTDGLASYLSENNVISLLYGKVNGIPIFDEETKQAQFRFVVEKYINELENRYKFLRDYIYSDYHLLLKLTLDTNNKQEVIDAIHTLETRDDVLCVSPNYYFEYDSVPNDEYLSNQWYLDRIDYFDALDYADNTQAVTVGIIDSGINVLNPDLADNVDVNLSKSFVDDEPLTDTNGHGTSVAGLIGACTGNEIGIAGICKNVNLVSLKVGSDSNPTLDNVQLALDYAEVNDIDLVNCSFGTLGFSQNSFNGMEECYGSYSGLIVCSAGNDGYDLENMGSFYYFPSALGYENIISVAATDINDELAEFENGSSNYGYISVDLAAPGKDIYTTSTNQNEVYRYFTGTSASAPIVTGVIALIKSIHPDISVSQLREFVLNNVDVVENLEGKVASGGIINANSVLSDINQKSYTIKYDANGGIGEVMEDSVVYYGVDKKLNTITYTKQDYRFIGWTAYRASDNKWLYTCDGNNGWYVENLQPDGYVKFVYSNGEKVSKTSSVNNDIVTMYAHWEKLALGDIDMDGQVSIQDATLLQKYLSGIVELTEQQIRLADVNLDGTVSIIDATEIQKIAAGI